MMILLKVYVIGAVIVAFISSLIAIGFKAEIKQRGYDLKTILGTILAVTLLWPLSVLVAIAVIIRGFKNG